jgi:hypothetical protein
MSKKSGTPSTASEARTAEVKARDFTARGEISELAGHGFSRAIRPTESIRLQPLRESLSAQKSLLSGRIAVSSYFGGLAFLLAVASITGCHSHFVDVTIDNQGPATLHLIEVDYPSASFGVGNLAANSQFHYRFKIQGSGPVKLEFTDDKGQTHNVDGPELNQGQEGRLTIAIDAAGKVAWQPNLNIPN